jgi:hypothetical protein
MRVGGANPVHPNQHIYAKAALNLMEKMANSKPAASGSGLPQNNGSGVRATRETVADQVTTPEAEVVEEAAAAAEED